MNWIHQNEKLWVSVKRKPTELVKTFANYTSDAGHIHDIELLPLNRKTSTNSLKKWATDVSYFGESHGEGYERYKRMGSKH